MSRARFQQLTGYEASRHGGEPSPAVNGMAPRADGSFTMFNSRTSGTKSYGPRRAAR